MAQIPNNLTEIQESFLEYIFLHLLHVLRKISGPIAFLLLFFFNYSFSSGLFLKSLLNLLQYCFFLFFFNVFVFCP